MQRRLSSSKPSQDEPQQNRSSIHFTAPFPQHLETPSVPTPRRTSSPPPGLPALTLQRPSDPGQLPPLEFLRPGSISDPAVPLGHSNRRSSSNSPNRDLARYALMSNEEHEANALGSPSGSPREQSQDHKLPPMMSREEREQDEDKERKESSRMGPPAAAGNDESKDVVTGGPQAEFSMRRGSIANDETLSPAQQNSPNLAQLGKRKESHDRAADAPASPASDYPAKRRGSNIERMPYLTLSERQNAEATLADPARVGYAISQATSGGPSSQWWANAGERRDSTASMYSNRSLNSTGGYNSASTAATSYTNLSLAEKLGGPIPPQGPITAFPVQYTWPPAAPIVQVTGAPPTPGGSNGSSGGNGGALGAPASRGPMPPNDSDRIAIDPALSSVRSGAQSPTSHAQYEAQESNSASPMGDDPSGSRAHKAQSTASGPTFLSPPDDGTPNKDAPFSRSPELRVSHKLAERKRRKEMKDLFDELREQLPADRGMKASKWEILSKAVDFISNMKLQHTELVRENEGLRREIDMARAAGVAQAQAQAQAQAYPPASHFPHHNYIPAQYPPSGSYPAQSGQSQPPLNQPSSAPSGPPPSR